MISSNSCRSSRSITKWCQYLAIWAAVTWLASCGFALDPNRGTSQYIRTEWGTGQGFAGGTVQAISQTSDGYLWIGSEKGLTRFDGLHFEVFDSTKLVDYPGGAVQGLAADKLGGLWIRLQDMGLWRLQKGKVENIQSKLAETRGGVVAMGQSTNGDLLFVARSLGIFRYQDGPLETLSSIAGKPGYLIISLAETSTGTTWLGTRDTGLYVLRNGQPVEVSRGLPDHKVNCLLTVTDNEVWIGTDSGLARWDGTRVSQDGIPRYLSHIQILSILKDRDSNIWVGTSNGLFRLTGESPEQPKQMTGEGVNVLFEDREGNLWVGTHRGIERFRDSAFTTYPTSQDPQSESNGPLFADQNSNIWSAPTSGGLLYRRGDQIQSIVVAGLQHDVVYSIAGRGAELWVGRRRGGLTHLFRRGGSLVAESYTRRDGLAQDSVYAVHQSTDGTVWSGTISGGVTSFKNGVFKTYKVTDGLASNSITAIAESADGTMWFATPDGISVFYAGHWRTIGGAEGLPPGGVSSLFMDSSGTLWIGTPQGLAFLKNRRVEIPTEVPTSLRDEVLAITEDKTHALWIATSNHILRCSGTPMQIREFSGADGLLGTGGVKRFRSAVTDLRGRVWISTDRGLSVVAPDRLSRGSVPSIVQIQQIAVDGRTLGLEGMVHIPAVRQRMIIRYSGLNLSVPEQIRFRYKLDRFDRDWTDPVTTPEAVYTNIGPGSYRFRVIASNQDGLWNSVEAAVSLTIEPEFWQTWWFRMAAALAAVVVITAIYQLRLRSLTRQLNFRFEERLSERTRIAQELHDTLLQGFLSATMQLHVALGRLPDNSPAKPPLSRAIELIGEVNREGRNTLRGLRASRAESLDLEEAFSLIPEELAVSGEVRFRVVSEGRQRHLHPILRDDAYRIIREAVVNAFRHSRAASIEVEIEYAPRYFQVYVRDDGCGIDPKVLQSGREGHWGLVGMRERAERIGAKLSVLSRVTVGTEVVLSVPGHIAFNVPGHDLHRRWLGGIFARLFPGAKEKRDE